jgi:hypothetical protein
MPRRRGLSPSRVAALVVGAVVVAAAFMMIALMLRADTAPPPVVWVSPGAANSVTTSDGDALPFSVASIHWKRERDEEAIPLYVCLVPARPRSLVDSVLAAFTENDESAARPRYTYEVVDARTEDGVTQWQFRLEELEWTPSGR